MRHDARASRGRPYRPLPPRTAPCRPVHSDSPRHHHLHPRRRAARRALAAVRAADRLSRHADRRRQRPGARARPPRRRRPRAGARPRGGAGAHGLGVLRDAATRDAQRLSHRGPRRGSRERQRNERRGRCRDAHRRATRPVRVPGRPLWDAPAGARAVAPGGGHATARRRSSNAISRPRSTNRGASRSSTFGRSGKRRAAGRSCSRWSRRARPS